MIQNLEKYPTVREAKYVPNDLIAFEDKIVEHWENGKIKGPVHLCNGNEEQLLEISKRMGESDWVFSTWRSAGSDNSISLAIVTPSFVISGAP